jgi:hypothetical protein
MGLKVALGRDQSVIGHWLKMAEFLNRQKSACSIGYEYLRLTEVETKEDLLSILAANVDASPMCDEASFAESVHDRIVTDFETEDVVKLQGWILSHTEARLCGLAYLTSKYMHQG